MQGTKLPRISRGAKLWIAGVSTLAILLGCETEPVKEQAANGNRPAGEESSATTRQGAVAVEAVPPMADMGVARKEAKTKADAIQGGLATPAVPAAEVDQLAGAAQGAPAMGLYPTTGGEAYRQRGDYFAQPVPREGAVAVEAVPPMADMGVARKEAKTKADAIQGGLATPAVPAAEVDQLAGAAQGAPAMGLYPTTGGEAYRQRGDYFAQPVPGE